MERTNLAGRAGRWSAAHWKTAFFGWLVFVFVAVFIGMGVGTNKLLDSTRATASPAALRGSSGAASSSSRRRSRS